jgi:LysM repeat protein
LKQLDLDQLKAATAASGQPTLPDATPPPAPPPTQSHIMGKTETVGALSKLYNVPMSAFQAANPNVDLNNVKPGDTIRVPQPASSGPGPQLIVPPGSP